jgi:ABC-2 type transport system permease protein
MGALLGAPLPLVELYGSEIKKAYKVGGIPIWIPAVNNFISATFHLLIVSIIIFIVAPIAFSAKIPSNLLVYFVSLLLFIMTSLAIGTLMGLLVKSTSKLTMLSQAIFLPSLMLSGIMFPASMLPKIVEDIGKAFPATQGYMAMTSSNFNIISIGVLLITLTSVIIINGIILSRISKRR